MAGVIEKKDAATATPMSLGVISSRTCGRRCFRAETVHPMVNLMPIPFLARIVLLWASSQWTGALARDTPSLCGRPIDGIEPARPRDVGGSLSCHFQKTSQYLSFSVS